MADEANSESPVVFHRWDEGLQEWVAVTKEQCHRNAPLEYLTEGDVLLHRLPLPPQVCKNGRLVTIGMMSFPYEVVYGR